jgi:hypothetical protein
MDNLHTMVRLVIVGISLAASFVLGVPDGDAATRQTCIASAELRSVNPVWGGHNMFLTRSRDIWMQIVEPSKGKLIEHRYRRRLTGADAAELSRVVDKGQFLKMKPATRPAVPGDLAWRAAVVTCDGRKHAVQQFASDAEPGFQDFVNWFQRTAATAVSGAAIYEGAPQLDWQPPTK